ncbi:MAG: MBL fold metallo-hydrolase [Myxococcota bacterium]
MIFEQLFDPVSSTYTYILADAAGAEAVIIDPVLEHVDAYLELIEKHDLKLVRALDTHVHADHVTGLGRLRELTKCTTIMGQQSAAECVSETVADGDVLKTGGLALEALYTPGHTDDSYCFLMKDRVFTGDTLLIKGTGRTDFQNGDARAQWDSIQNVLLKLSDDVWVYPAHDYRGNKVSSIGEERHHNPRLQVANAEAYAELMANLNLPNPKLMDVAVPANRACGRVDAPPLEAEIGIRRTSARAVDLQKYRVVDVREAEEWSGELGHILEAQHVPLGELEARARDWNPSLAYLFVCRSGRRSATACQRLKAAGFEDVTNMEGGMLAWIRAQRPVAR